jgi:diguanylate cyclase (GGDEF)-like protein
MGVSEQPIYGNRAKRDRRAESLRWHLVEQNRIGDDRPMGNGTVQGGSASEDGGMDDSASVVDELTGLANRRGFMEILRLEERRHARYGGSPILVMVDVHRTLASRPEAERPGVLVEIAAILADCIRDTDTLARVDDERFAILAIQAGADASSIVGRLRLHLELRRIHQTDVAVGEPGSLGDAWRALDGPAKPNLRLVR